MVGATYQPPPPRPPAAPASGTRRSRLHDMVGYAPEGSGGSDAAQPDQEPVPS